MNLQDHGFFYALYPDEDLWHERCAMREVAGGAIVVTPDGDVYVETTDQYSDWEPSGVRMGAPARLAGKPKYQFAAADRDFAGPLMVAAERDAARLERRQAVAAGAAGLPLAAAGPRGGGQPAPSLPPLVVGSVWHVMVDAFGVDKGTAVTVLPSDRTSGENGFGLITRGGATAPVSERAIDPADDDDIRILPLVLDQKGARALPFAQAVSASSETAMADFPIGGPRTTLWLLSEFRRSGFPPMAWHHFWKQAIGGTPADAGIDEHGFLCECLETAATFDQLNVSELAAFE